MLDYPAWKNGKYCKVKDLTVSVLDLGLIHCDATYDVIAVKNAEIQNLQAHLQRFVASSEGWRIPLDWSYEDIAIVLETLVAQAPTDNLLLWIGVTRGTPSSGNPRDLSSCKPNMFMYAKPYYGFNKMNSATICLAKQQRNTAIDQRMKNFAWNDLNLAQWEAIDRGYDSAILLDNRGFLTEGIGFNVGIVKGDEVYAPKHNRLEGTVMSQVEAVCREQSIPFHWSAISSNDLLDCDAMFLTSTAGNVITVTRFENKEFEENYIIRCLQKHI